MGSMSFRLPVLNNDFEETQQEDTLHITEDGFSGTGLRVVHDPNGEDNDVLLEITEEGMSVLFHPGAGDSPLRVTFVKGGKLRVEFDPLMASAVEVVNGRIDT